MSFSEYNIILASNSPRRSSLLAGLDIKFETRSLPDIDESYPDSFAGIDIVTHIAKKKAEAYASFIDEKTLLITADTIVRLDGKIYGKPKNEEEAKETLRQLSGKTHEVISGVCITTKEKQKSFGVITEVRFRNISETEIEYYVTKYKPMDKAGAYGIQEWIGHAAVEHISGSFSNVMGLPIQRLYQELKRL